MSKINIKADMINASTSTRSVKIVRWIAIILGALPLLPAALFLHCWLSDNIKSA